MPDGHCNKETHKVIFQKGNLMNANTRRRVALALVLVVTALFGVGCTTTNGSGNPKNIGDWTSEGRAHIENGKALVHEIKNLGGIFN